MTSQDKSSQDKMNNYKGNSTTKTETIKSKLGGKVVVNSMKSNDHIFNIVYYVVKR